MINKKIYVIDNKKILLWMKGVLPNHCRRLIKDPFWCHLESISLEVQWCFFEILVSSFLREREWPLQFRKYGGVGVRIADNVIHSENIFLTGEWWYELKNPENDWEPFGYIAPLECGLWVETEQPYTAQKEYMGCSLNSPQQRPGTPFICKSTRPPRAHLAFTFLF